MNLLECILLALFLLASATGIVLWLRLGKRKRQVYAVLRAQNRGAKSEPDSYELAAIDQLLYDRCCAYMTEHRPFLAENFTRQDLANAVFTNKAYLSKTINRFSGRNFRQYVNYYRVMYAMELFRANMSLRITELASLSGFHSPTSFLLSFKAVMGEPPSLWCSKVRKKYLKKQKL